MTIEIIPAQIDDKSVLRNLMVLYLYDFSEYTGSDVNEHGLFEYDRLDDYWTDADRHPFLVRVSGKLAGFVLVRDSVADDGTTIHNISEFFILRKYRRQKVGRTVAYRIFDRFPGKWQVAEIDENKPAQHFWRTSIADYTGGRFEEIKNPDWEGPVQEFFARPTPEG